MSEFPRVYVARAAKATGKLDELRQRYAEAVARGYHVHWVGKGKHTCRNGTPECPYYKEEE